MDVTDLITRIETVEATIHCLKIEIIKISRKSIQWSIEDFQETARQIEENRNMPNIYDSTEFQNALERMIEKHDAEIGITWETVRYYLDEYCLKNN